MVPPPDRHTDMTGRAASLMQEVIRKKRDGARISAEEIADFVAGLTDGSVSEGQVAALAMAIIFRGLDRDETVALTLAMRDSGRVLDWTGLTRPVVDKHSTGGVGDNVSLMLAPIVAACGAAVPMISGRGLGHTGGTLDKMESIPGYVAKPDPALFRRVVETVGCAIIGQTDDLAPADRRFYAIRDTTGTVESVALITASILSKKLAAGLGALVLDVKFGNGAFMDDVDKARALARSLVEVATGAGLKTTALLTDMNQPLASAAGNALEVENAAAYLEGSHRDPRLHEVTIALAAEMLVSSGIETDEDAALSSASKALESGRALEHFARMVHALGGPADFVERRDRHLAKAPVIMDVPAPHSGIVAACKARDIGVAVIGLGGGRRVPEDRINPAVGLDRIVAVGSLVEAGQPLARIHAADRAVAERAAAACLAAMVVDQGATGVGPAVLERITTA